MPPENEKLHTHSEESEVTLKPSSTDDDTLRPSVGASQSGDTHKGDALDQAAPTPGCQPAAVSAALRRLLPLDALDEARAAREGKRRSAAIDEYLKEEGVRMRRDRKIIVLGGTGDVDILFHRAARLAKEPLTDKEREESTPHIRREVFSCVRHWLHDVIDALNRPRQAPAPNAAAEAAAKAIADTLSGHQDGQEVATAETLFELLQDPEFEGHLRQRKASLEENSYYSFSTNTVGNCSCGIDSSMLLLLRRIFAPDYVPTDHDWCHFSKRKYGLFVDEVVFDRGSHRLDFLQIGRGGGERKKWIHLLQNCAAVVTVIDLACYDSFVLEDADTGMMMEALALFDSVCNSRHFSHVPHFGVLINADKFRKKMGASPSRLGKVFPEFQGADADAAIDFLRNRIKDIAKERADVYTHVCDLLDPASFGGMMDFIDSRLLVSPALT